MWSCTKMLPKSIMMKIPKCKSLVWCDAQEMCLGRDVAEIILPTPTLTLQLKTNQPQTLSDEQVP